MTKSIHTLRKRFLEITKTFESGDYDQDMIYKLEDEIQHLYEEAYEDKEMREIKILLKQVKEFKKEHDFYDPGAELDRMFPDRHDDDFDEDQMSWESVFGD